MKFGEQLSSHLTPEWRKQYINYEALKTMLYECMMEVPAGEDEAKRIEFISQMDERFFAECERSLTQINLFFSQKIAEAQGKYHELQNELGKFKGVYGSVGVTEDDDGQPSGPTATSAIRRRFGRRVGNLAKEQTKTSQQLKLAFSEFYLSLVLVQNYQQLNATGFRKILKKHDKLTGNERGLEWRINKVEKSSFFLNRSAAHLSSTIYFVQIKTVTDYFI